MILTYCQKFTGGRLFVIFATGFRVVVNGNLVGYVDNVKYSSVVGAAVR